MTKQRTLPSLDEQRTIAHEIWLDSDELSKPTPKTRELWMGSGLDIDIDTKWCRIRIGDWQRTFFFPPCTKTIRLSDGELVYSATTWALPQVIRRNFAKVFGDQLL